MDTGELNEFVLLPPRNSEKKESVLCRFVCSIESESLPALYARSGDFLFCSDQFRNGVVLCILWAVITDHTYCKTDAAVLFAVELWPHSIWSLIISKARDVRKNISKTQSGCFQLVLESVWFRFNFASSFVLCACAFWDILEDTLVFRLSCPMLLHWCVLQVVVSQFCDHIIHIWIFELSEQIPICWHLKNRHTQGKQPRYSWNCKLARNFKLIVAPCLSQLAGTGASRMSHLHEHMIHKQLHFSILLFTLSCSQNSFQALFLNQMFSHQLSSYFAVFLLTVLKAGFVSWNQLCILFPWTSLPTRDHQAQRMYEVLPSEYQTPFISLIWARSYFLLVLLGHLGRKQEWFINNRNSF